MGRGLGRPGVAYWRDGQVGRPGEQDGGWRARAEVSEPGVGVVLDSVRLAAKERRMKALASSLSARQSTWNSIWLPSGSP